MAKRKRPSKGVVAVPTITDQDDGGDGGGDGLGLGFGHGMVTRRSIKASASKRPTNQEHDTSEDGEVVVQRPRPAKKKKKNTKRASKTRASEPEWEEMSSSDTEDDIDVIEVEYVPQYKDDSNAFNTPVEEGKDYISGVPPEVLKDILFYLILDNDPERAARLHASKETWAEFAQRINASKNVSADGETDAGNKPDSNEVPAVNKPKFEETSHVLLSMAAMSRHFRDNVEDFARREMTKNKQDYYFKSNQEREAPLRRSERLKALPQSHNRCYRFELVSKLVERCIVCRDHTVRRAILASKVACHSACEKKLFPGVINLSDAKNKYDLRDWMLIPSRKPGPRAKQVDIPGINYGTEKTGLRGWHGTCISYKFLEMDVKALANAVHGDVTAHMAVKNQERKERKKKRRKIELRKLYAEHEKDIDSLLEIDEMLLNAWDGLGWSSDSDLDSEDDERLQEKWIAGYVELAFGPLSDEHRRICPLESCAHCAEGKFMKYNPWY